ncbi:MAG: glycosyltransferase, partial [Solirubrobacterales bacterium]|nr:glycosyltransferase [Solirubrobacterales bacterium]
MTPRVSVCVPAYQSEANLQQTLDSVWGQDFEDLELVIVDDGSSDATSEIIAAQTDPRLRAFRHEPNRGQAATVGEAVARARGDLVKFLDADDILHADCLGTMVRALDEQPDASFAFCRREILAEDPDDPGIRSWIEVLGDLPGNFSRIEPVNDGRALLREYLAARLPGNWIAEPAGVMARRSDLLAVGGYNRRLRQNNDMDLWVRLMTRGSVVFVDRPLYTYRLEYSGVTGGTEARALPHWLDSLWTAEGLFAIESFPEPQALRAARRELLRRA